MVQYRSFTFNPVQEETYLAWDDTCEAIIIDPGCSTPQEQDLLKETVEKLGLHPVHCLCTHCHFDHVWGIDFVYNTWGLSPEANPVEIEQMPSFEAQISAFGLSASGLSVPPYIPFNLSAPGEITFGDSTLRVYNTPGHSPGHVAFYAPSSGLLFSGDLLFRGSVGRTDLWMGCFEELLHSIAYLAKQLPKETTILPGHGPATTLAEELAHNPYLRELRKQPD